MTKKKYRNIIFDLGGVLFDIDYERTFIELGEVLGFDVRPGKWPDPFYRELVRYETGKINTETFLWKLQHQSRTKIPDPAGLIRAWNSMLRGWHPGVFATLEKLSEEYRLFLLSNINPLHFEELDRSLAEKGGIQYLNDLFQGAYYSHLIGHRKPSYKAFEKVVVENKLEWRETLFIDDFESNVIAARSFGMSSVCHKREEDINKNIFSYLSFDI